MQKYEKARYLLPALLDNDTECIMIYNSYPYPKSLNYIESTMYCQSEYLESHSSDILYKLTSKQTSSGPILGSMV